MTATEAIGVPSEDASRREDPPEQRMLRAAAQLAGTAILAGSIATLAGFVLTFAFPVLYFFMFPWPYVPIAAASGGIAGGAGLAVTRVLGWGTGVERVLVPAVAALGSVPVLFSVSAVSRGVPPWLWAVWIMAAVGAAWFGRWRTLRRPLDEWRGADMSAVDWAKIDFAFGVAQPRVEGRCPPG